MRVAACISGQLRTLGHCFPSMIQHILSPSNADVFIYAKNCTTQDVQNITQVWPKVQIEIGQDIDQETLYSKEDLAACDKKGMANRFDIRNFLAQTQSIKACNSMRNRREVAEGFKYDLVIRLRTDAEFFTSIHDPSYYNPSLLYVPDFDIYNGINDRFAIAGPDVMDIYAKWGDEVVHNILQNKIHFQAEPTLKLHIDNYNITTAVSDTKFTTDTLIMQRHGKMVKIPYSAKFKPRKKW